ncbi:MAG: hypothetical protein QOI96_325 [Verrucomicrobiota bacterium]
MAINAVHAGEDVEQDFRWRLRCVNHGDRFLWIMGEHRLRFGFISREAALNDLLIGIVEAVVFEGALFQSRKKRLAVRAREVKNSFHVNEFFHDLGLGDVSWNAIEYERVDVWFELVRIHRGGDRLLPKLNRNLIGHELAFAGKFEKRTTHFRPRVDGAKDVSAGAMIIARDGTERFTLSAFAAARRTEENEGRVSHEQKPLYRKTNVLGNVGLQPSF